MLDIFIVVVIVVSPYVYLAMVGFFIRNKIQPDGYIRTKKLLRGVCLFGCCFMSVYMVISVIIGQPSFSELLVGPAMMIGVCILMALAREVFLFTSRPWKNVANRG